MQRLVLVVVVLGLLVISQAQIQCSIEGNTGTGNNLINALVVNFGSSVSTNYSANQLIAAFSVQTLSGRPLIISTATTSGTNVTVTFRRSANNDPEWQTGLALTVNYTQLADVSNVLIVNGAVLTTRQVCASVRDLVRPVLSYLHAETTSGPNAVLVFSEPVQKCGGGNIEASAFTFSFTPDPEPTTLTPFGSAPTNIWYFPTSGGGLSGADSVTLTTPENVCDATGNTALGRTVTFALNAGSEFIGPIGSSKYYDLNRNGLIDAALLVVSPPLNETALPFTSSFVLVNGQPTQGLQRWRNEGTETDNMVLFTFPDVALTSTITIPSGSAKAVYGPGSLTALHSITRTLVDFAPPVILSAISTIGSNQVTLGVSEAHSSALNSSQFEVYSPYGLSITGSTGTPTTTQITLRLSDNIRYADAFSDIGSSQLRVYLKLQDYGTITSQGLPLWRSVSPTSTVISHTIITRVGTGAWDTLTLTLTNAFSASDLSTSSLSIVDTSAIEYTVETAVALSSTQARFTVSQVCLNASEPCIDTSPSILYNVTIGNQSATLLATEAETAAPVFVGASAAVGSNIVRVRFSEPVVGWSPSALFSGLSIASIVDGPIAGWEKTLTLSRGIKAADLTKEWLETELVDALGNTDTEVPLIFAVTATAHDDDGDGLVTRIRLTTNRQHQAFSSSDAFATVPAMTLGAVTRVSTTVSDIAVTQHAVTWGSSLSMQYKSHASVGARVLLSADLRGGLELPLTTFSVESSEEALSSGSSSFSDLSTATQAGIIAGIVAALLAGILLGSYWRTARVTTKKKHRHELMQDSSDIELE